MWRVVNVVMPLETRAAMAVEMRVEAEVVSRWGVDTTLVDRAAEREAV